MVAPRSLRVSVMAPASTCDDRRCGMVSVIPRPPVPTGGAQRPGPRCVGRASVISVNGGLQVPPLPVLVDGLATEVEFKRQLAGGATSVDGFGE